MSGAASASAVTSGGILANITSVDPGGELEANGSAALVDVTSHTVTVGGEAYRLTDVVGALIEAVGTPVKTISANGATEIPIPAFGNVLYEIDAAADAALQFSGEPDAGQTVIITLRIPGTSHAVALPTDNVDPEDGVTLPTAATTDTAAYTEISYRATGGTSSITGGI